MSIDLNSDTMPEMIYRFIEQNVRPGPHISLKCSARGSPPPQVILMIYVFKIDVIIFISICFLKVYMALGFTTNIRCKFIASLCNWTVC